MSRGGHAAVVMAAGGSRRLGRPKQLLVRDGETLLARALRLAAATRPRKLVVVLGCGADGLVPQLAGVPAQVLVNPRWESGLASTLQVAARALRADPGPVLLLGCDQPLLEAVQLRQLLDAAAGAACGCAASVYAGRLGLPAVVSAAMLRGASGLEGDRGFGAMLNAIEPQRVGRVEAPELAFDIDVPEDAQAAVARGLLDSCNGRD